MLPACDSLAALSGWYLASVVEAIPGCDGGPSAIDGAVGIRYSFEATLVCPALGPVTVDPAAVRPFRLGPLVILVLFSLPFRRTVFLKADLAAGTGGFPLKVRGPIARARLRLGRLNE